MPPHEALTNLLLQKCTAVTTVRRARRLHALLLTSMNTPSRTPFLNNNILSMYSRCGSIQDVHHLFDGMPHRNLVSYNVLLSVYSRSPNHYHLSFLLLDRLRNEGLAPNELTMVSLLQAAVGLGSLVLGSLLHGQCMKMGLLSSVSVEMTLVGMYSSCGDVDSAHRAFSFEVNRDAMVWDNIISGHVKNGRTVESLRLFCRMLSYGVTPTEFTYSSLLNACAKLQDCGSGKILHAQVLVSGIHVDLTLQNSLLDMYCTCGEIETAFEIFSRLRRVDLVSWNSMIGGYSENGDGEKAMSMFVQLKRECKLKPDEYSFAAVILGTSGFQAGLYGKPLHAQIVKTGFTKSKYIGSKLISMYFNGNDPLSSQRIFSSFSHKDVVLWTDMISGLVKLGESEAAILYFHDMFQECCDIDSFVLSSALSACADLATLRQGKMIHCLAIKTGNDAEMSVQGSLVDMYCKNGTLKAAARVFSSIPNHNLQCWNSMLGGYGQHGEAEAAFYMFDQMLVNGLKPNHITFISLLSACSHCGLVDKGMLFWNCMKENGLAPGPKHYSCMITMLSRAGLLEEAEEVLMESPFLDMGLWRTILSSCVKNGNLNVGLRVAERALEISEEDRALNVLIMKLYSIAGKWDEVSEMRRRMSRLMMNKDPGLSWIDVR